MTTYDPKRRILLRMAAGGCLLATPILFSACGKDESPAQPETGADPSSTGGTEPATPASTPDAAGGGKISQAEANYQSSPRSGQRCGNCQQFIAENNSCRLVEGPISPDGWCKLWTKKG